MLILPGSSALSAFRQERLLAALTRAVPAVQNLSARHVHFVATAADFSSLDQGRLNDLLADVTGLAPEFDDGTLVLVIPRPDRKSVV